MSDIVKMFNEKIPFAVMQYFESLKTSKKETCKKYELMYLDNKKLIFSELDSVSIDFLKRNTDLIKLVIDNQDGMVWEFNDFKKYKEEKLKSK